MTLMSPAGHLISVVLLALPLRHIVGLYLYVLTALLLYMGHQISRWEALGTGSDSLLGFTPACRDGGCTSTLNEILFSSMMCWLMHTSNCSTTDKMPPYQRRVSAVGHVWHHIRQLGYFVKLENRYYYIMSNEFVSLFFVFQLLGLIYYLPLYIIDFFMVVLLTISVILKRKKS